MNNSTLDKIDDAVCYAIDDNIDIEQFLKTARDCWMSKLHDIEQDAAKKWSDLLQTKVYGS